MANSSTHEYRVGNDVVHAAHHFEEGLEQQRSAERMGMWTFLITELFFFSGLIASYVVYRIYHHEAFAAASHTLNIWLGLTNTVVLLLSSLTAALAHIAALKNNKKHVFWFIMATIFLAFVFLGVKSVEWTHDWHEHLVPGRYFEFEHNPALKDGAQLFFLLYFCMTGVHALHIIVGIGILAFIAFRAWKGRYNPLAHVGVENVALYWHFVDIVWVFLFPILYVMDWHP
jgi:cytochrome c oxidase subunit 3